MNISKPTTPWIFNPCASVLQKVLNEWQSFQILTLQRNDASSDKGNLIGNVSGKHNNTNEKSISFLLWMIFFLEHSAVLKLVAMNLFHFNNCSIEKLHSATFETCVYQLNLKIYILLVKSLFVKNEFKVDFDILTLFYFILFLQIFFTKMVFWYRREESNLVAI